MNILPALTDYLQQYTHDYCWRVNDNIIEGRLTSDSSYVRIVVAQQDNIIFLMLQPVNIHAGVDVYESIDLCDPNFQIKILRVIQNWTGQVDSITKAVMNRPLDVFDLET